ncbi:MAG: hypothetical protein FH756_10900 [Firmicutes bacterium]|nr:hypothetical protein [Bacillota bacterium]
MLEVLLGRSEESEIIKEPKANFLDTLWGIPKGWRQKSLKYALIGGSSGFAIGILGGFVISLLLGLIVFAIVPRFIYTTTRDRFVTAFRKQFPRAVTTIAAHAAVGSYVDGISSVASEFQEPARSVFAYINQGIKNGDTAYKAVERAIEQFELPEMKKLSENLRIIEELGGGENARETLESASEHIRFLERYRQQVDANTAEIRTTAVIADLVPVGLFIFMCLMPDSDHRYILLHDRTLIFIGLGAVGAGWLHVRSVLKKYRNTC